MAAVSVHADPKLIKLNTGRHGYEVVTVAAYPCALVKLVEQLASVLQAVHPELVQIVTAVVIFALAAFAAEVLSSVAAEALIWFTVSV